MESDRRYVYQYDLLTEELTSTRIPEELWDPEYNHIVRHGAVDYSTGIYYFATSHNDPTSDAFALLAYDPNAEDGEGAVWRAGQLHTPDAFGDSGDMAFDSLGNLYFIVGAGSDATLYTAEGGQLPTTPGGETVDLTLTQTGDSAGATRANGVGVAYGRYGYLYLTFTNGMMYQVDPSTGDSVREVTNLALPGSPARGASTDLASCTSPSTLTVRKNVVDRAEDSDQFTLDVIRHGTPDNPNQDVEVGHPVTTTGDEPGLQDEVLGPVPVVTVQGDGTTPWQYTVRETAAEGTDFDNYATYYRCVDMNDSSYPPVEGVIEPSGEGETVREFDLTIPARGTAGSRAVVCTFTNAPPGTPRIVKGAAPGTPQEVLDDVEFTGTYRCEYEDDGDLVVNESTWSAMGPGPARLTPAEGSDLDVPVGSVCEVVEDDLEEDDLPDASWSWGARSIGPPMGRPIR